MRLPSFRLPRGPMRMVLLCLGLLSGCAPFDYQAVSRNGRFDGRLFVMWVGEGAPFTGDGSFVFVPNPRDPLTFTRFDSTGAQIGPPIRPEMMYTDGGSIPRIATVFRGLSPWGYAPAYMIHDWLFIANHCLLDGTPSEEQKKFEGMDFHTSAVIIAEAIRSLQISGKVAPNDVAAFAVASAVAGPISARKWKRRGACAGHTVSERHRQQALTAFPPDLRATPGDVGLDPENLPRTKMAPTEPAAIVIGEFGF